MKIQKTQPSLNLLPQEIIEEILSTLDVKSLLILRCVSKSCRSLIDSKRFIKTHLQKSRKDTTLAHHRVLFFYNTYCSKPKVSGCSLLSFFDKSDNNAPELNFPTNIPSYSSISFVGCCNGLVCILLHINMNSAHEFILWNPSTRISKKLPAIDKNKIGRDDFKCYGFGWDEWSDDYKVIAIAIVEGQTIRKLYSLKTDSWKKNNACDNYHHRFWYPPGMLASGKLHWVFHPEKSEIVAFDLKREVFEIVEQPCYSEGRIKYQFLGTFGECLAVQCYYEDYEEIWAMKEYGVKESWVKLMVDGFDGFDSFWTSPSVSAFYNGAKGDIVLMNLDYHDMILLAYDLKNKCFHSPHRSYESDIYVESLVSPLE